MSRQDSYGTYTPSDPMPPVPSFPCPYSPHTCTAEIDYAKYIEMSCLCVCGREIRTKNLGRRCLIPYGKWEDWEWYYDRIGEALNVNVDSFRLVYAGCQRSRSDGRHSGLLYQSSIHCVSKVSPSV
jgi:hypothetical protein